MVVLTSALVVGVGVPLAAAAIGSVITGGAAIAAGYIQRPKREPSRTVYYPVYHDTPSYSTRYETLTTDILYNDATKYTQIPSYYTTPFQTTMYYYR